MPGAAAASTASAAAAAAATINMQIWRHENGACVIAPSPRAPPSPDSPRSTDAATFRLWGNLMKRLRPASPRRRLLPSSSPPSPPSPPRDCPFCCDRGAAAAAAAATRPVAYASRQRRASSRDLLATKHDKMPHAKTDIRHRAYAGCRVTFHAPFISSTRF